MNVKQFVKIFSVINLESIPIDDRSAHNLGNVVYEGISQEFNSFDELAEIVKKDANEITKVQIKHRCDVDSFILNVFNKTNIKAYPSFTVCEVNYYLPIASDDPDHFSPSLLRKARRSSAQLGIITRDMDPIEFLKENYAGFHMDCVNNRLVKNLNLTCEYDYWYIQKVFPENFNEKEFKFLKLRYLNEIKSKDYIIVVLFHDVFATFFNNGALRYLNQLVDDFPSFGKVEMTRQLLLI